jgi:hypothetical protein
MILKMRSLAPAINALLAAPAIYALLAVLKETTVRSCLLEG